MLRKKKKTNHKSNKKTPTTPKKHILKPPTWTENADDLTASRRTENASLLFKETVGSKEEVFPSSMKEVPGAVTERGPPNHQG